MSLQKINKLTTIVLSIFEVNRLLLDWGDNASKAYGLTSARWQVLGAIALSSNAISIPKIAEVMGITRQGALKQVNFLLAEGFIHSQDNPDHKNSLLYICTTKGMNTFKLIEDHWNKHLQEISEHFDLNDLNSVIKTITLISDLHKIDN